MLDILNSQVSLIIGLITVIGLLIGPKAWPGILSWLTRIWEAVTYPFKATDRLVALVSAKVEGLEENHINLDKKLDLLLEQFTPNGGSSLRDSLNRIEARQKAFENENGIIINNLEIPMFKINEHGVCDWASRHFNKITGRTFEHLKEWGWNSAIHPEDVDLVQKEWEKAAKDNRSFEAKYRFVTPEGTITSVHGRATPTFFNGKIVGWIGSLEILK